MCIRDRFTGEYSHWSTVSHKHTDYAHLNIYFMKDAVLEIHSMVDTSIPLCTAVRASGSGPPNFKKIGFPFVSNNQTSDSISIARIVWIMYASATWSLVVGNSSNLFEVRGGPAGPLNFFSYAIIV